MDRCGQRSACARGGVRAARGRVALSRHRTHLERGLRHLVSGAEDERGLLGHRPVGPGHGKPGVQRLRRGNVQPQLRQVRAQRQHVQRRLHRADDAQQAGDAVAVRRHVATAAAHAAAAADAAADAQAEHAAACARARERTRGRERAQGRGWEGEKVERRPGARAAEHGEAQRRRRRRPPRSGRARTWLAAHAWLRALQQRHQVRPLLPWQGQAWALLHGAIAGRTEGCALPLSAHLAAAAAALWRSQVSSLAWLSRLDKPRRRRPPALQRARLTREAAPLRNRQSGFSRQQHKVCSMQHKRHAVPPPL